MGNSQSEIPKPDLSKINPKDVPCLPWLNKYVSVYVYSVTDGDTLKVLMEYNNELFKFDILLDGIDTPEIIRCSSLEKSAGLKVKEYVKNLVEGKTVTFYGKRLDNFGNRIYGDVFISENNNLGNCLLEKHYGHFYNKDVKNIWSEEELNKILIN